MLLLVAPDLEGLEYVLSQVTINETVTLGNVTLYNVTYGSYTFAIAQTGYGKVNIGRALTMAMEHYEIDSILGIGTAGQIDRCAPELNSAVIGASTFQYDVDFTALGDPVATLPDMDTGIYDANDQMVALAVAAAHSLNVRSKTGIIASADRFVADSCLASYLNKNFDAIAVDAECGAVGEVAYLTQLPFTAIKVTSNNAGCDAATQYRAYNPEALLLSQKLALAYIQELA